MPRYPLRERRRLTASRYRVFGRVAPAVLRVVAERCGTDNSARAGSGFAWQQPGQVVTDLHVVAGCTQFSVGYQQLDVRPARVVRVLRRADLALLSVDGAPAVTPLSLAAQPPAPGRLSMCLASPSASRPVTPIRCA